MPHYLPGTEQCHLLYYLCISLRYIKCEVGMPHYLPGTEHATYYIIFVICRLMYIKCEVEMPHYLPGTEQCHLLHYLCNM